MLTPRAICLVVAAILFLIASYPPASTPAVRFEYLAAAFVVLAWLV